MARDLIGEVFGRWTVVAKAEPRQCGKRKILFWLCRCDCGTEREVDGQSLKRSKGGTKSCGCLNREQSRESNRLPPGESAFNALFASYSKSAKSRDLVFDLARDEFHRLVGNKCTYCGCAPATVFKNRSGNGDFIYNGIDRADNEVGYTLDNSVSCCQDCNYAKWKKSKEEFIQLVERIYENIHKANLA